MPQHALTHSPIKAVIAMVAGVALLTASDAASKHLTQSYPIGQVVALRQTATLLVILPYVTFVTGWRAARVVNWPGQIFRALLFVVGSVFMVTSLSLLPLTTVIAIIFTAPIFIALMSAPLLGERVGAWRWTGVLTGFSGVLVIVRPGGADFQWILLLPVCTALTNSLRDIVTRRLSRTETSVSILLCSSTIVMLAGFTTAPFGWAAVDANGALWFLLAGLTNAGAHFFVIEALRMGEASLVSPFRYTAFLWAMLFGFLLWGEVPGLWVAVGVGLIICGGLVTVRGESKK